MNPLLILQCIVSLRVQSSPLMARVQWSDYECVQQALVPDHKSAPGFDVFSCESYAWHLLCHVWEMLQDNDLDRDYIPQTETQNSELFSAIFVRSY